MGKEQDLIDAGRTGNLAVIEKVFGQKSKKSAALVNQITGAFASLRRLPNINSQGTNGDTPLHGAALNGHREVVCALLQYEALANVVDNRGCLPLHLAAWNGHDDICEDLLVHGPSLSKPNEQNYEGETALLCAAQHGHTPVINVLLKHGADSGLRNHHQESPLDLACQYGRLDTVRLLLIKCPNLTSDNDDTSSALHLAARNGHLNIVQLLVQCRFNINSVTESGTALHEAAVYGKEDVVQFLLSQGIDVYLKDSNDRTALEVLSDQKSQKSLNIGTAILDHLELLGLSPTKPRPSSTVMSEPAGSRPVSELYAKVDKPYKHRDKESVTSECSTTSTIPGTSPPLPDRQYYRPVSDPIYDVPTGKPMPIPPGRSPALSEGSLHSPHGSPVSYGVSPSKSPNTKHEIPRKPPRKRKTVHNPPPLVSVSDPADIPTQTPGTDNSFESMTSESPSSLLCEITEQDSTNQLVSTSDYVTKSTNEIRGERVVHANQVDHALDEAKSHVIKHGADVSANSSQIQFSQHSRPVVNVDTSRSDELHNLQDLASSTTTVEKPGVKPRHNPTDAAIDKPIPCVSLLRNKDLNRDDNVSLGNMAEDSEKTTSGQSSRPCSLEFGASGNRSSAEMPLSPSGYRQPPTPDFPPPSPATAQAGIHDKIDPIIAHEKRRSRELELTKRRSRDIDTITEDIYLPDHGADNHHINSPIMESPNKNSPQHHDCSDSQHSAIVANQRDISADNQALPVDNLPKSGAHSPVKLQSEYITSENPLQAHTQTDDLGVTDSRSNSSLLRQKKGQGRSEELLFSDGEDPFVGLARGAIPMGERRIKSQIYDNLIVHPIAKLKKRLSVTGCDVTTFDPSVHKHERTHVKSEDMSTKIRTQGVKSDQSECCDSDSIVNSNDLSAQNVHKVSQIVDNTEKSEQSTFEAESKQDEMFDKNVETRQTKSESLESSAPAELRDVNRRHLKSHDQSHVSTALDETEEWAQIAGIMASFGGSIARESVFVQQYEQKFTQMLSESVGMQSVGDWLDALALPQYENILIPNGFDDMEFMGADILEYNDVVQMEITDKQHIHTILDASSKLPSIKYIGDAPIPASVADWLDSLQLSDHLSSFQDRGYNKIAQLRHVWELDSVMDTISLGHRKRMLASLRHPPTPTPSSTDDETPPIAHHSTRSQRYVNVSNTDDEDSVFKDYTATSTTKHADDSELDIRPPAVHSAIKQWRHRPEVLIKGCCNYVAQYLGSKEVKSLVGLESTKESITKMKISTQGIAKVPSIILSISYKGVKFIDGKSKRVVCEHEIGNIFCACQDGDHLNHFAYITKDLQSQMHYCHVFSVSNTELATEIILTLGEAFEVAYQMAMKEQSHNAPATHQSRDSVKPNESKA